MSRDSKLRRMQACCLGALVGIALSQCTSDKKEKTYDLSSENTEIAIVMDGKVYINPSPDKLNFVPNDIYSNANNVIQDTTGIEMGKVPMVEYNINQVDNKTLIIYTYSEDEDKRNSVMNYIISNVSIDEDNTVHIEESNINQQGYSEYISKVLSGQSADVQRTRKEN